MPILSYLQSRIPPRAQNVLQETWSSIPNLVNVRQVSHAIGGLFLLFVLYRYLTTPTTLPLSETTPLDMSFGVQYPEISDELFLEPETFKLEYLRMERKFKVFMYPLEEKDTFCYELDGKYATEGYFYKNVKESQFLIEDPNEAHLFFVPLPCFKERSLGEMVTEMQDYLRGLISKYPYWNTSSGADHFIVTCQGIDAAASPKPLLDLMKNTIRVVCSPTSPVAQESSPTYPDDYVPSIEVSLPQVVASPSAPLGSENDAENRTILGLCKTKDKHIGFGKNDPFKSSMFCTCPNGSEVPGLWIADAISHGCVPVISSVAFDLPLKDILNWQKFSLKHKADDVNELARYLVSRPFTELKELQRAIVKVQKYFQWNSPPVRLDAFHMVMYELGQQK